MSATYLTQLGLSALAGLKKGEGFKINDNVEESIGISFGPSHYPPNPITDNTILGLFVGSDINPGIMRVGFQQNSTRGLPDSYYRRLITMGATSLPGLSGSHADTITDNTSNWKEKWSFGSYRILGQQAFDEFRVGTGTYNEFCMMFSIFHSFMTQQNTVINSYVNANKHLDGTYSNLNDLLTGDIAGVSLATLFFGQDLINLGKSLDLSKIDKFGYPSELLKLFKAHNGISRELIVSLLYVDLTTTEIDQILDGSVSASNDQEKRIYKALSLVSGDSMASTLTPMNCKTQGLRSLADLLDLKKIFPQSYSTLTVPEYNSSAMPTNSKTYFLIYQGDAGVNPMLNKYGTILKNFIPEDLAVACDSFSISMQQIKNIKTMHIEKFATVVSNLEISSDLDLIGGSGALDKDLATDYVNSIALGSGPDGTFTMIDFLGSMTGMSYNFDNLISTINAVDTSNLTERCEELLEALKTPTTSVVDGATVYTFNLGLIDGLIEIINTELLRLSTTEEGVKLTALVDKINDTRAKINRARDAAIEEFGIDLTTNNASNSDINSFVLNTMSVYSAETLDTKTAQVIEALMDLSTVTGQSLMAAMRESRNKQRLELAGAVTESDVPADRTTEGKTTIPLSSSGETTALIHKVTGRSNIPGSLSGSEYDNLVPPNLEIFNIADSITGTILTPAEAVETVILCNCDCWDLLR